MRFLDRADVLAAAAELAGRADELGDVDLMGLEAALFRVRAAEPEDAAEAAAIVFAELARVRLFPSANRAVAWLAACQLLSLNGGELPAEGPDDLVVLLGQVAAGGDVDRLTKWIRARCGPAGRRSKEGPAMFERFSDDAREVVEGAREEARELRHDFLGTEHLLLGLLRGSGVAAAALGRAGVTAQAVRDEVQSLIGPSAGGGRGAPHFTPRTKKVLELSLREAMRAKSRRIEPEHILLGVLREGSGVASQVLEDLGVEAADLRRDLERGHEGRSHTVVEPGLEGVDLGAYRQRMLGDLDALTGRIRQLEAERDRLRGILHRHGIEPDGGERSA